MKRPVIASLALLIGLGAVVAIGIASQPSAPADARRIDGPPPRAVSTTERDLRTGQIDDPGRPTFNTGSWNTDFNISAVPFSEIVAVLPRDAIPAIDVPQFESIRAAREWLDGVSPVIALEIDGEARAYPLAILTWHEIVNDTVAGQPVAVTFCPLCHTALVYDRTLDGEVRDFGVSGNLRFSDLIMYDRQTQSWWQQATGKGIVGDSVGQKLGFRPSQLIGLDQFAETFPDGVVLSRDTGHRRNYGFNPYPGYDVPDSDTFFPVGVTDGRLALKERVVTLGEGAESIALPYTELRTVGAAQIEFDDAPVLVLWEPGAASSLDALSIDDGEDVGGTGVFSPIVDDEALTFVRDGGEDGPITDVETGSTWDVTGRAIAGPLEGTVLDAVPHGDHFWFAWAAFAPGSDIWTPEGTVTFAE